MILIHKKTCRLSPGGVTISAFDHIKKDTEISRKNMLPCGSLPSSFSLSSSSFTKNPFYLQIYTLPMGGAKFVHPALFSIFITSLDLHVLVYSKNALGLCGILIAVFSPSFTLFFFLKLPSFCRCCFVFVCCSVSKHTVHYSISPSVNERW